MVSIIATITLPLAPVVAGGGGGGGGGTGAVTHGDQLTLNSVGPWTLQGVAQGSETLTALTTTQLAERISTFPGNGRPSWISGSNYVNNNNPSNHGGTVPGGGMTIDGWSVPAGTWVAQFYDCSADTIIVEGDATGAGSAWPGVMFRGCRMRNTYNAPGFANNNAQTTNGLTWFNYCDAGGPDVVPTGGSECVSAYESQSQSGTSSHMYVIRCYISCVTTASFGRNTGDGFIENYIEGIVGYFSEATTPFHLNGLGNQGGEAATLWLRNHLSTSKQWDLTGGQSSYVTGGSSGTAIGTNPFSVGQTDIFQMGALATYPGTGINLDGSQGYQIRDNYLGGGNFTLQLGLDKANTSADVSHVVVTGNKFSTYWFELSGSSGLGYKGPTWGVQGNTFSGNIWADDYGTGSWSYTTGNASRQYPAGNGPRALAAVSSAEIFPGP